MGVSCRPNTAEVVQMQSTLPTTGFLRLRQIIGDKSAGIPAIIPVARSTFLAGVRAGVYPKPVKLSPGVTAWRVEDIRHLIASAAPVALT
jgi:predicted DNA-binding transcriptional regulator AlpA